MSPHGGGAAPIADRLAELRREFDGSFAGTRSDDTPVLLNLLCVTVGEHPYAVRLAEVRAVVTDRLPSGLPGRDARLAGVIGLRGSIVPVFDLAAVLGHPSGATPRWSVVTADDPPLALAVSGVDGQLRVPAAAVSAHAAAGFVAATVATPRGVRPVIDLGAVHAAVRNETGER